MFRKILIFAMFATAAGYCFAAEGLPQVVTSEVFYVQDKTVREDVDVTDYRGYTETVEYDDYVEVEPAPMPVVPAVVPAWPIAGSDADVEVGCGVSGCAKDAQSDNIRIVSKIGADLVVENNFNMATRDGFGGWSGGANMLHGTQIPVGFADECNSGAEMPLLSREMMETDGGSILTVSRSGRKNCAGYSDGYAAYAARMGFAATSDDGNGIMIGVNGQILDESIMAENSREIAVDSSADAVAPATVQDQVRSWVVANGQTMREVLQSWCDKEGWDLVWATSREYPIEASAVFKGRFVDVASALVRNFSRATPIPYAKFYKGNRVLVISTVDE